MLQFGDELEEGGVSSEESSSTSRIDTRLLLTMNPTSWDEVRDEVGLAETGGGGTKIHTYKKVSKLSQLKVSYLRIIPKSGHALLMLKKTKKRYRICKKEEIKHYHRSQYQ